MKNKFYLVLALIFICLNIGLGSWGLTESSEARYAEIGREMAISGDYLHPRLLGIQHFHKPPITYYLTALGYHLFGANEFGARFFLCVALVLQIFFVYKIALLLFRDEKVAFSAGIIYFCMPLALVAARNLTTDAYLTTFILWSLYYWLLRKKGRSVFFLYGFYLLLGIGFLTKGPVVLLPVLVFIICWKIFYKDPLKVTLHNLLGTLLFLAVSASWFVAVIIDIPALWDYFIKDQIVKRSLNAEKFHRQEPFWYYFVFAPLVGLPWLLFTLAGFVKNYKGIFKTRSVEGILSVSIGILMLIFSLFSSKLILYILPIFPFIALLGAKLLPRASARSLKVYRWVYMVLLFLLACGLIFLNFYDKFEIDLWWSLAILILVLGSAFWLYRSFRTLENMRVLALGFVFSIGLLFTYHLFAANNPTPINSIKEVTSFINKQKPDHKRVIVYDYLLPSAAFYLDEKIVTVNKKNFNTHREVRFEEGDAYKEDFIDLEQEGEAQRFTSLLKQKNNVLIKRKKAQVPEEFQPELQKFPNRKEIGKWEIYY